jgi:hypothetical protein
MNKEFKVGKKWVSIGASKRRFAIGFAISPWSIDIDFLWFWIGVEL